MVKKSCLKLLCVFSLVFVVICAFGQNATPGVESSNTHRKWQYGAFFQGGIPIPYPWLIRWRSGAHETIQMAFYNVGFEGGWVYTASRGPGLLRGRAEQILEVSPLWLAHYPGQWVMQAQPPDSNGYQGWLGFDWSPMSTYGVSVTPLLTRWNFMRRNSARAVPWVQAGSGMILTTKDFPTCTACDATSTSKFNFSPQIGLGTNIFMHRNQSLNFGVKFIHISSAGIGKSNPGIKYSANFSIGYSWWR